MFSTSLGIVFLCVLPLSQNQGQEVTPKESLIRLIEKLKSDDESMAEAARHDLAALPKEDKEVAVPLLIKALKDTRESRRHGQVRWCFDGMGQVAIPFLMEDTWPSSSVSKRELARATRWE
jgi:hypothetical protein